MYSSQLAVECWCLMRIMKVVVRWMGLWWLSFLWFKLMGLDWDSGCFAHYKCIIILLLSMGWKPIDVKCICHHNFHASWAICVALYTSVRHPSSMSFPLLAWSSFLPALSIIPIFNFLLLSILQICPNRPSFLFRINCVMFSVAFNLLHISTFVTLIIQFTFNILCGRLAVHFKSE